MKYQINKDFLNSLNLDLEKTLKQFPCFEGNIAYNFKDLTSQQIGSILVLYRGLNGGKRTRFVCKCQNCGKIFLTDAAQLRANKIKSCGCRRGQHLKEGKMQSQMVKKYKEKCNKKFSQFILNKKIGKILFIEEAGRNNKNEHLYKGICDCGKQVIWPISEINRKIKLNRIISCGCYQYNEKNLTGQRFGKLIAIKNTYQKDKYGNYLWECQCDCGNKTIIPSGKLTSGNTQSCGCLLSKNNIKIEKILEKNKILFEKQFYILNKYRMDFFINNQYMLEYDGEGHFFQVSNWDFKKQHEYDLIKNKYCFDNNIPLIRIPYDAEYTIDDLKLETTRFLFTPENEEEYYKRRTL